MTEKKTPFQRENEDIAWCPGCGNFLILDCLARALDRAGKKPRETVISSGIGQAAKLPQYLTCNYFNGLHGRALPVATGIKMANPGLTVIAESGDGCMYGEGGNHFIHTIRRNPDLTTIVHNNMVYGLTKGQASPTSRKGFTTPVQTGGVVLEPFNPLTVALSLKVSFAARAFAGDKEETVDILTAALSHTGYALVDILQPCVSFNKVNTFKWYKEHSRYLEDSHNPQDCHAALHQADSQDPLMLGIFYQEKGRPPFEQHLAPYQETDTPLYQRTLNRQQQVEDFLGEKL
mgnify:CR=1 FL=1